MGGDPECFTVWIPLHDCPVTWARCKSWRARTALASRNTKMRIFTCRKSPTALRLVTPGSEDDMNAGDVLVFHSLTVHAASPNLSKQMRLSIDCRFQDYRRAIDPASPRLRRRVWQVMGEDLFRLAVERAQVLLEGTAVESQSIEIGVGRACRAKQNRLRSAPGLPESSAN